MLDYFMKIYLPSSSTENFENTNDFRVVRNFGSESLNRIRDVLTHYRYYANVKLYFDNLLFV